METIETLIPDNEGNHLVVVLYFYTDNAKLTTFRIPRELSDIDIADININKLILDKPLGLRAMIELCRWLRSQFSLYPNAVFSFICSTDPLEHTNKKCVPELYRWLLFEALYKRNLQEMENAGIQSKNIIVGMPGFQTYARVFYRNRHAPIIHIVIDHLKNKYTL